MLGIALALLVITTLVGLGIKALAPGFDVATIQAISAHRSATLTSIAGVVTDAGSLFLLAPLTIAFLLLRRWKRPADDLALIVIAAGCAALPSIIKLIVGRARPTVDQIVHMVTLSFPSEHATQAAGIYLAIAILLSQGLDRRFRGLVIVLAIVIALAVAWSRVYLGLHYPTDVAAGLLLGWSWALLVFRWARPVLPP